MRRTYERFSLAFTHPELDHGYLSTPQPELNGRQIAQLRGKVLGGSSHTNFQIWALGGRDEFEFWAREVDGPEWGIASVLENIKKVQSCTRFAEDVLTLHQIENVSIQLPDGWEKYVKLNPSAHGFNGYVLRYQCLGPSITRTSPVDVSIGPNVELEAKFMLDAGVELGVSLFWMMRKYELT